MLLASELTCATECLLPNQTAPIGSVLLIDNEMSVGMFHPYAYLILEWIEFFYGKVTDYS